MHFKKTIPMLYAFFLKRPFAFCLNTQGGLYKCQWVQPADL